MDSLALLGAGHARGRVPLRSGLHAGPRTARSEHAGRVLRHHSPGPGAFAGQADRRAVGSGRRGLPGGQLSRVVVGMERQVPRLRSASSGKATAAWCPNSPRASPAPAISTNGAAAARTPASISSPATTASRLNDLVSYDHKHNEANGEENRDGESNNNSWNCGAEGPTDDPAVNNLRETKMRSFLATLLLSQGVPMLLAGDEMRPHPARQQQRLLPGQRGDLARLGRRTNGKRRS